jgi:hypothetical protein
VAGVPADADPLADLPPEVGRADFLDRAHHFVAGNKRVLEVREVTFFGDGAAVANAARLDLR